LQGIAPSVDALGVNATTEGASFATTVRSQLRRDPDVLAIPEVPDPETLKEVANADHERTRVYVAVRAEGAIAALQTFVKASGNPDRAATVLRGAVGQRLLRKLCQNCRVPYQPSPELLQKLGVQPGKVSQLFKPGGQVLIKNKPETCPVCNGLGYSGQIGAFEVFDMTPDARTAVREGNWKALVAAVRKQGAPTIQQAAIALVLRGETTIEEVSRVTSPAKPPKPDGAKPAAAAKPG
jgi:type IV pilus assembly protein PilB